MARFTFKSAFMVTRAARWFFFSVLVALPLIQMAYATPDPSVVPPIEIQELWNGSWVMTEQGGVQTYRDCCDGPGENIPLTPKYRKIRTDYAAIPFESPEKNAGSNLPQCITPGMPGIIQHPMFFEFSWAPGRVNIVYNDGTVRKIWTDGRSFPERLILKWMGTSIGHWEGSTLVVETRGILGRSEMFLMGPIRPTPQTRVAERFMVKRGSIKTTTATAAMGIPTVKVRKHLHLQATLEDSQIFLKPYTFDLYHVGVPIEFETGCAANNRNDGVSSLDLTAPEED